MSESVQTEIEKVHDWSLRHRPKIDLTDIKLLDRHPFDSWLLSHDVSEPERFAHFSKVARRSIKEQPRGHECGKPKQAGVTVAVWCGRRGGTRSSSANEFQKGIFRSDTKISATLEIKTETGK